MLGARESRVCVLVSSSGIHLREQQRAHTPEAWHDDLKRYAPATIIPPASLSKNAILIGDYECDGWPKGWRKIEATSGTAGGGV
jgi:hypothetical protein